MTTIGVKLAWGFSAAFLAAAILGFVPNPLLGEGSLFVTNTAHNLVHLFTAFGFVAVALMGNRASTRFLLGFGLVYLLVGVFGIVTLGGAAEGHLLGLVHINSLDNFLHLGLGVAIATGGLVALNQEKHAALPERA